MHRNLDRRVETLVRVDDLGIKARLEEILDLGLHDRAGAWALSEDARWTRKASSGNGAGPPPSLQAELQRAHTPK